SRNPNQWQPLSQGLASLAPRLEPKEAMETASILMQTMSKMPDLSQGLLGALLGEDASGVRCRAAISTTSAGVATACGNWPASLPALYIVLPPPCRLTTHQLVDLLKHPFCVGAARRVVLDQLENRYRRKFADQWEFVRYAQGHDLGVDFATSAQR